MSEKDPSAVKAAKAAEVARSILEKAQKERGERCTKEVNEVLKKHSCILSPSVRIVGNQISSTVIVVPLPEE